MAGPAGRWSRGGRHGEEGGRAGRLASGAAAAWRAATSRRGDMQDPVAALLERYVHGRRYLEQGTPGAGSVGCARGLLGRASGTKQAERLVGWFWPTEQSRHAGMGDPRGPTDTVIHQQPPRWEASGAAGRQEPHSGRRNERRGSLSSAGPPGPIAVSRKRLERLYCTAASRVALQPHARRSRASRQLGKVRRGCCGMPRPIGRFRLLWRRPCARGRQRRRHGGQVVRRSS